MKEIVAEGLALPEGPVVLPDGRLAFVEQARGQVSVLDADGVAALALTRGSPNGLALGADGALYAAQNGGVEGDWRSSDPATPGIQRVRLDGTVDDVAHEVAGVALLAPNDLAFGADGRLWFTDPAHGYDPVARGERGRLFALAAAGGELVAHLDAVYPNGIGFLPDGTLVWAESYERHLCALRDGRRQVLCQLPQGHIPDGLAVAEDGRVFVATVTSGGVTVVSPEGAIDDVLALDDGALATNCCFDGTALWVTDFGPAHPADRTRGRLWRVDVDARGMPLHAGTLPPLE